MKRLLLLLFFYVNVASGTAQVIIPDTSIVSYRSYNEEVINLYKVQKEYNYELDPKYEQNPIKRLWYSMWRNLLDRMGQKTLNLTVKIIMYSLIILVLLILVRFLLRSSKTSVFKRGDKSPDFHGTLIKSESGGENLSKLIDEAEKSGNYSIAIRYLYIRILRELDKAGKIEWRDYKTNYDYEREIQDVELRSDYARISNAFEYVVYGDLAMDHVNYTTMKGEFGDFESSLKQMKTL